MLESFFFPVGVHEVGLVVDCRVLPTVGNDGRNEITKLGGHLSFIFCSLGFLVQVVLFLCAR